MGYRVPNNNVWKTGQLNADDLGRTVKKIHICAYPYPYQTSPESPGMNHWCMFLQHSAASSVKVDMYSWGIGTLEIASKQYIRTDQAVYTFSLDPVQDFTVKDFIKLIDDENLAMYNFTETDYYGKPREGCRFWNFTVIEYLEREGHLPEGTFWSAWEKLSYYYSDSEEPLPREIQRGTFV